MLRFGRSPRESKRRRDRPTFFLSHNTNGRTPDQSLHTRRRSLWRSFAGLALALVQLLVVFLIFSALPILVGVPVIAIRFFAIGATVIRRPIMSVCSVPTNWWRNAACVDSAQSPQVLPGHIEQVTPEDLAKFNMPVKALFDVLRTLSTEGRLLALSVVGPALLATIMVAALPALAYRWSLKGVSLIYSPLVWLLQTSLNRDVLSTLRSIANLAMHRAIRVYAAVILLLLTAKACALYLVLPGNASRVQMLKAAFCSAVIVPNDFPPWQVASAFNAALTWISYWATDAVLHRIAYRRGAFNAVVERYFRALWFLLGFLSIYTIACGIYLAAYLSGHWSLPSRGVRVTPW